MFAAEARRLEAIAAIGVLRTPTLIALGQTANAAFLVLEYLDLAGLDASGGAHLGAELVRLHRATGDTFG